MRTLRSETNSGFTLIEMLVAMVVLLMIMAIIFEITNETGRLWKNTSGNIQSFQAGRAGFESMTRRLSQATLNTYYDYFNASEQSAEAFYTANPTGTFTPATYGRYSELQFVSGAAHNTTNTGLLDGATHVADPVTHAIFFQAPLGYTSSTSYSILSSTLNAVGYYIDYCSDQQAGARPGFVPASVPLKYRYRLMQFTQPTESLPIFLTANQTGTGWLTYGSAPPTSVAPVGTTTTTTTTTPPQLASTHMLAENIVAMVILPKESPQDDSTGTALCPNYTYNSRASWTSGKQPLQMNQLPPVVHVVMIAIDEPSAMKICTSSTDPLALKSSTLFQNASLLASDLSSLEAILDANSSQTTNLVKLNYRVFDTDVAIRGAKWSQ